MYIRQLKNILNCKFYPLLINLAKSTFYEK
jgi:hypothetical protein